MFGRAFSASCICASGLLLTRLSSFNGDNTRILKNEDEFQKHAPLILYASKISPFCSILDVFTKYENISLKRVECDPHKKVDAFELVSCFRFTKTFRNNFLLQNQIEQSKFFQLWWLLFLIC